MLVATLPLLQSQYLLKYFVKVLCWTYLLLVLFAPKSTSTSLNLNQLNHTKEEVCGDIDIRNSVKNFDKLKNCSVIEGHLQILLIDRGVPSDYDNLSFPKLREITDFLLLYRVVGLRTLSHLFPNLAVIRGSKLFHNYAFVVYEMMSLQEIGLASLTNILRGSVHIEKNPQLCYVNTIDWDLIARSGPGHFIKTNKVSNQCPNDCPQNGKCPLHPERNTRLCWDSLTCQKVCSATCSNNSCMTSPERCCNNKCLGGCNGDKPGNCFVCRNVVYQGQCLESCFPNTYEYAGRRCITEDECKNMPSQPGKNITWKLFGESVWGKCLPECPSGFMDDEENKHTCRKCKGPCPKVCQGIPVDSVAAAQELRGCTRINGRLDIQISGGRNVIHELEENLGKIEEVDDYVKIVRSFPLVTLNFLKNLRKIHGKRKENENYSLLVFDNHNLQEIMDFKNRTIPLEIVSGKMFFHNNPKLCPSKIEELRNYTGLPKWDDSDVSPNSNGDRVACNIRPLRVWVKPENIQATIAVVYWENFLRNLSDHRSLLAYVVSYKEAPYRNITLFDGRDACGTDSWKVRDVSASSDKEDSEIDILDYLKPFTQYAVFVRTYTVGNEKNGAQSPIIYFTTLPDTPSSPLDLKATSPNPSQLKITWLPPIKPNGNVTHYVVTGYYEKDEQSFLDRRNYCLEPLIVPDRKKVEHLEKDWSYSSYNKFPRIKPTNLPENCCQCPKEKKLEEEKDELEFQIIFEDTLHNHVYIKRPVGDTSSVPAEEAHQKRRRRSINSNFSERPNNISKATITPRPLQPLTTILSVATSTAAADAVSPPAFNVTVNMTAGVVVFNLTHFSEYTIEVIACHEPNPHNYERCSKKSITTARTAALDGSDNINSSTIQTRVLNGTTGKVRIQWEEPPHPNGLIVSYHIEFKRTKVENYKPTTVCITHKHYREKKSYMLSELGPGNYSLKLRATSLAGDGEWTSPVYFVILEPSGGLSDGVVAAITAIGVIAFIFLIVGAVVCVFKQKLALTVPGSVLYASVNPEYISAAKAYVPDEWEVPRKKISTTKELGRGSFGTVFEGTAKKLKGQLITKVAVKTTNPNASADEMFAFLQEASVMKAFNCHHVVRLLGVVSKTAPPLVIMELMSHGDLKTFLRMHNPESCGVCNPDVDKPEIRSLVPSRKMYGKKKKKKEIVDDTPPTLKRLYQMAVEIADGMAYLSAKKFVHRDLAARNCLVAEDMTVKIGDFGLTRDIYETDYYRKDGKGMLPIRWMAPEAVRDGVFTSQSDVWSYGIVLWEMVTRAAQPYTTMKNSDVHRFISDGGIMGRPSGCPEKMYHLMSRCWNKLPQRRPTFRMLTSELLSYANEKFHKVAFYYTSEAERLAYSEIDIEDTMPSTHLKLYLWNDQDMPPEIDDECWGDEEDVNNSLIVPNDEDSASDDNTADKRMQTKVIHPAVQCINFDEEERNFSTHSSDSSKGLSLQSSEGSKVSGRSVNGGLANGHMHFPVAKSTQC